MFVVWSGRGRGREKNGVSGCEVVGIVFFWVEIGGGEGRGEGTYLRAANGFPPADRLFATVASFDMSSFIPSLTPPRLSCGNGIDGRINDAMRVRGKGVCAWMFGRELESPAVPSQCALQGRSFLQK